MHRLFRFSPLALSLTLGAAGGLLAAGCGGGSSTPAATTPASTSPATGTETSDGSTPTVEATPVADQGGADPAAQVAQGATVWSDACAMCHGESGEGKGARNPAVVGGSALGDANTAADLHSYIAQTMPKDDPGSLSDADAWAVTAWIVHQNGKLTSELTAANAASVSLH